MDHVALIVGSVAVACAIVVRIFFFARRRTH